MDRHKLHAFEETGTEPTCPEGGRKRVVVNIGTEFAVKFLVARLAVILAERPGCATFDVLSQVSG